LNSLVTGSANRRVISKPPSSCCRVVRVSTFKRRFTHSRQPKKYLKAFLVWHQIEFPKTHDIGKLITLAADVDVDLPDALGEAETLTPFGVDLRYPGDYADVTSEDAQNALAVAKRVRDEIRNRLPDQALE